MHQLHQQACDAGLSSYTDPDTGFMVFTEIGLRQRGRCCGCSCRHCPYAHDGVPLRKRAQVAKRPTVLSNTQLPDTPADILFWSGGKDSFLAYLALRQEGAPLPVLLTTYDANTRVIANQEISIDLVIRQANHLNLPLIGVPLQPSYEYNDLVIPALSLVSSAQRLIFGDLHLQHIRQWREQNFLDQSHKTPLHFPLWHKPYSVLLDMLEASNVPCKICALDSALQPSVKEGALFNRTFVQQLPPQVDAFGENGEFHTIAHVWEVCESSLEIPV